MPPLSIVIPCYNEAGNIPELIARFARVAKTLEFELVLVDNGSTDATPQVLREELSKPSNAFARTVRVERNIGYGFGLQQGLQQCRGDVVGFTHADLQCPPEDLITGFDLYQKSAATGRIFVVKGRRAGTRAWPDRVVTWFYNLLSYVLLGLRATLVTPPDESRRSVIPDVNAEPKIFSKHLVPILLKGPHDFTFDLFVLWAARHSDLPILEFQTSYLKRVWGTSKLAANPVMRLKTSLNAFKRIVQLSLTNFRRI